MVSPRRGDFISSRAADDDTLVDLRTDAKISLSDVDNKRGYEMTVTGSGFNNGTTASVYVLHIPGSDQRRRGHAQHVHGGTRWTAPR